MSPRTKMLSLMLSPLFGIISFGNGNSASIDSVVLYTPYTKVSVAPGATIDYAVDIINNSREIKNVDISVTGLTKGWNYTLRSGNWNISQLSILPGGKESFTLRVDVPLNVNKGSYRFRINAGESVSLPLVVIVSEQGTFKTEYTASQSNLQGPSNSTFNFSAKLMNRTADKQLYALFASAPRGWNIIFKVAYQQVTSTSVEANSTQDVAIEIKAPESVEAGKYKITAGAAANSTSANLDLEVVITGSFSMDLTTQTGLLNTSITKGEEKRLDLIISNTGSSELSNIEFECSGPVNWDAKFDPKKIAKLQPGKSEKVILMLKPDKKAIPGDYAATISAKTVETSSKASIRVSVETPMLYGWIGVFIIMIALGSVYYLFRRYGRR
jgi:uncharacterized membrane protein